MAERIQVNFGWLNDYSGAKFAPLTLSDKILMPDEDKTFGDYVEDNFDSFKTRLNKAEKDIDLLELLNKATHDPVHNVTVPEHIDKTKIILDVFGANYLLELPNGYYSLSNSDYNQDGSLKDSTKSRILTECGISAGFNTARNEILPIYFQNGRPVAYETAKVDTLYNISDKLITFKQGNNLLDKWTRLEDFSGLNYELVDTTKNNSNLFRFNDDLNNPHGLNIHIKGNARTSTVAFHALQSTFSHYSHDAAIARSAKKLDYNIKFSHNTLPTDKNHNEIGFDPDESHIKGILNFNNINFDQVSTHTIGLRLVDILNTDGTGIYNANNDISADSAGSYGVNQTANYNTADALSVFNIPDITVDTTGRITNISQKAVKPTLQIKTIAQFIKEDDKTSRAAVIGCVGNVFVHAGAQDSGIYLDWSGGAKKAVLMGAAWNDYAEYRSQVETIPAGYCVASHDNGKVYKTIEKFQACDGIVSDTFGFSIGQSDNSQTPLAVSGRVLAYYSGNIFDYHAGDTVCAGPEGKICKMTREEIREWPDRIIGIVSEIPTYEYWNDTIPTKGRIWIKIK